MAKEPTKLVGGMVGAAGGYTDGHTITTGDERRFWGVQTLLKAQIHELVADPTIGLMGIPYDGANSRTPGTRFGPRGVRTAGARMAGYSAEFNVMPHSKHRMADFGDVILSPFSIADAHQSIENAVVGVMNKGALPISVGGDHSVTLPLLRGVDSVELITGKRLALGLQALADRKLHSVHGTRRAFVVVRDDPTEALIYDPDLLVDGAVVLGS